MTTAEQIDTLFIPSPINAPDILDLDAERSLLGFLGDAGMHPALLDWGRTDAGNAGETLDSYVTDHLLPLLGALSRPVHLVGYCLGGTIAMAAACLHPVRSLTLIAAPWDFAGYPPERRDDLAALWQRNQRLCRAMGVVPMELIQSTFWTLSGEQLVEKYRRFGAMPEGSAEARRFVAIEDWANGGEPLPYGVGRQLFEDMFAANRTGNKQWRVNGQLIAPSVVRAPAFELASDRDAIVPLACSPQLPNRSILGAGHVGMVIGGSAPDRLWQELKDWLLSVGTG